MSFPTRTFSPVGSWVRRGRQEGWADWTVVRGLFARNSVREGGWRAPSVPVAERKRSCVTESGLTSTPDSAISTVRYASPARIRTTWKGAGGR
ncbi:hypothetical protein MCBG_04630 [Micromonospora sp. M42]|nr:hypothetical protein MCBG_04630 [Micromonospora sp. M42]